MKLRFDPQALTELVQAMNYLDAQRPGLGAEFHDELDRAIELIQNKPDAWRVIAKNIRRYRLHRFSYYVIYEVIDEELNIVAIMHTRRKPGYWSDRV